MNTFCYKKWREKTINYTWKAYCHHDFGPQMIKLKYVNQLLLTFGLPAFVSKFYPIQQHKLILYYLEQYWHHCNNIVSPEEKKIFWKKNSKSKNISIELNFSIPQFHEVFFLQPRPIGIKFHLRHKKLRIDHL